MKYKLTLTIKDLQEEEIPQVMEKLKQYEDQIEKVAMEKEE